MLREGFGTRLGALVIDIVFLVVVVFIIRLIGGGGSMPAMPFGWGGSATGQSGAQAVSIGLMILGFVISIGYSLTEIFMAGTPGKQILGIIIADESGVRATTQQLATRWMIKSSG